MKLIFIILNLIALSHICSCSNSTMLSESLAKTGSNRDSQKYYSYGVTLTFPQITQFSNPKVTLRVIRLMNKQPNSCKNTDFSWFCQENQPHSFVLNGWLFYCRFCRILISKLTLNTGKLNIVSENFWFLLFLVYSMIKNRYFCGYETAEWTI